MMLLEKLIGAVNYFRDNEEIHGLTCAIVDEENNMKVLKDINVAVVEDTVFIKLVVGE